MRTYFVFILFVCVRHNGCVENTDLSPQTLKLAHILFRHGDRTYLYSFPKDPHKTYFKEGLNGQLTKRGMQETYDLGKTLRKRYKTLVNNYTSEEVYVLSTDYDRTLTSAQCLLAGMFPPPTDRKFEPDLPWQPIPVHTVPKKTDLFLSYTSECPRVEEIAMALMASPELKNKVENNEDLLGYLTKHTGQKVNNLIGVAFLYDTFSVQKIHNLTIPPWVDAVWSQLEQTRDLFFESRVSTAEQQRLRAGSLIKEILSNMKMKARGELKKKLFIYSSHDGILLTFMLAVQVRSRNDFSVPPYASAVIVELHQVNNSYFVQIMYRNVSDSDPVVVPIAGCTAPCPLTKFEELTAAMIPTDINRECSRKVTSHGEPRHNDIENCAFQTGELKINVLNLILGFLAFAAIIAIIVFLLVRVKRWSRERKTQPSPYTEVKKEEELTYTLVT